MEGMFRQVGIYSSKGQLYTPQDADQLMYYREDIEGQILEEARRGAPPRCQQHHGLHPAEVGADLARSPTPQGRVEEVLLRSERTLPR